MIDMRNHSPRGRLVMPDRKILFERELYVARQDFRRELRKFMGHNVCFADQQIATQTFPVAPSAGNIIKWYDSVANVECFMDSSGKYYGKSANGSIAAQGPTFAADTWLTDSDLKIPSGGLQARTQLQWKVSASKTGAGVATPIYIVRLGAARSTADTAALTLTGPAQTAIADIGTLTILVIVRVISATVGIIQGTAWWDHRGTAASSTIGVGFANDGTGHVEGTSGNLDTSVATQGSGRYASLSLNGGASAAWTVTQVQGEATW